MDEVNITEILDMENYIGVKLLKAAPMTRGEYNKYRGWELPENEKDLANEAGMLVEYNDPAHPNHPDHKGYISWSPLGVFNDAYRKVSGISFGLAIEAAKKGHRIARKGWNGKNMFVVFMPPMHLPPYNTQGTERKVNDRTARFIGRDKELRVLGYFAMYTASEEWLPGWLASQTDMLSDDWMIID